MERNFDKNFLVKIINNYVNKTENLSNLITFIQREMGKENFENLVRTLIETEEREKHRDNERLDYWNHHC